MGEHVHVCVYCYMQPWMLTVSSAGQSNLLQKRLMCHILSVQYTTPINL